MDCLRHQWRVRMKNVFLNTYFPLLFALAIAPGNVSYGQFNGFGGFQNVGGVLIDANGAIRDVRPQIREELSSQRSRVSSEAPVDLADGMQMRKISLRALQEALVAAAGNAEMLPPEVRYMSGLQRIQYVFVYPEQNDIVLAGPGEAWRLSELGQAIGKTTGRPVVELQDLLVALRGAYAPEIGPISCSIEPTPEGIRALQQKLNQMGQLRGPGEIRQVVARKKEFEESLGSQQVLLSGVDPTTHFAWTLVAADYRMKCLGMGLEPAPIRGMPSYPEIMHQRASDLMPRWWMETDYDPLLTDEEGLAWELRGQGVRVLAEDELVTADGQRKPTGKVNKAARRWAETMTEKYDELSIASPIFGQLRNCMDMAVIAALIRNKQLDSKAGLQLNGLLDETHLAVPAGAVPRTTPSIVSFLPRRRSLVITASGGVLIQPWKVIDRVERSDSIAEVRSRAMPQVDSKGAWHWD